MRKVFFLSVLVVFNFNCSDKDDTEFIDETHGTEISQDKKTSASDNQKENNDNKNFTDEKPVAVITPVEAGEYNGRVVTVKGFVADVYKSEKVAYLNFVEKFPKNPFTAVIFASRFEAFNNIYDYKLKDIEVTGRVSFYRGKPQIIVDGPEQIVVLD